eukprot:CAMPEP_0181191180 /NCGR_PEP_ID=MMETSP1096-20121128/12597_1 /TAXON_ID=156174 ORGANISM="Chrysochromulina ericina, Strain CCMP281" /NCGR_SAMPLE_ID=MMETSP1096 /ASSEMBLY_ACC=CAM_ASM_000453 /LENGTH=192 /DNA_ID=CAMNT_0023280461 /DNA_START=1273 /DNA_END=1852 /DNA_ORIENTATION=-
MASLFALQQGVDLVPPRVWPPTVHDLAIIGGGNLERCGAKDEGSSTSGTCNDLRAWPPLSRCIGDAAIVPSATHSISSSARPPAIPRTRLSLDIASSTASASFRRVNCISALASARAFNPAVISRRIELFFPSRSKPPSAAACEPYVATWLEPDPAFARHPSALLTLLLNDPLYNVAVCTILSAPFKEASVR